MNGGKEEEEEEEVAFALAFPLSRGSNGQKPSFVTVSACITTKTVSPSPLARKIFPAGLPDGIVCLQYIEAKRLLLKNGKKNQVIKKIKEITVGIFLGSACEVIQLSDSLATLCP